MDTIQSAISQFVQKNGYPDFSPKVFFFDMDGVLFNSMPRHARSWMAVMKDLHVPFSEYEVFLNEGKTGRELIDETFLKNFGRHATDQEKEDYYKLKSSYFDAEGAPIPMTGIFDVLKILKSSGVGIFVVTGSGQPSLLNNLEHYFPTIFEKEKMVTAFDVKKCKPDPEPYLIALKKSGVKPWEAVVVENAPLGVQAGHAAGLFTVGVNTGILHPEDLSRSGADLVLNDMYELQATITKYKSQVTGSK